MRPDHLSIMDAEYNRMARREDAKQHRLRTSAGVETNSAAVVGLVVTAAVSVIKRALTTVTEIQAGPVPQTDARSTDTMSAITSSM
ncbi:MAG: hypothetical protein IPK19_17710 [Chloroflexi bacterium]|nr:hypothetical protein [Chloroflexota bacterium]